MSWTVRALKGVVTALVLGVGSPCAAAAESPYVTLPASYGDAVVTVRYVIEVNMPGVSQEVDREVSCLMIDPSGLVLCSNAEMGGYFSVMARLIGRSAEHVSSVPRDIRVEVPGQSRSWEARFISRDSDRDLAWLLLEDVPKTTELKHIDFGRATVPVPGDEIFVLRRLGKFFGKTAVVAPATVAGILERPRPLFLSSRPVGYLGMPAFDHQGRVIGVVMVQVPRSDEGEAPMQSRGLPGQAGVVDDMVGRLILPASEVVKATRLAEETWQADQDEALK